MRSQLITFIEELKSNGIDGSDEESTKQAVILRALHLLGWNIFDTGEVKPQYVNIAGNKPDYSLRIANITKVYIEVKKINENLDNHQEQLLNYSFQEGVKMAVLTNGLTWWFYLPLNEGSWDQRKFYSIDISEQNSELIADKFSAFLSKENICNSSAFENAEELFKSRQRNYVLRTTLPTAWNKIIDESDDLLLDLLNETTEKMCGFKADQETLEEFFNSNKNQFIIGHKSVTSVNTKSKQKRKASVTKSFKLTEHYTGKQLTSFIFEGKRFESSKWIQILIKLCELFSHQNNIEFERILSLEGRVRPYFSINKNQLRSPEKISGTNIFMETNLGAESIVKLAYKIIILFGYKKNSLEIIAISKH
jgi:predicted type IV restriction endonuclease